MLPLAVPHSFRIIAHRGASAYAPENTLAAFRLAVAMGITEIEVDAQLTTDGEVVLCHDHTLERYGHGAQIVERLPSSALLGLDMGSWFSPFFFPGEPMVTLNTLFEQFQDRLLYHLEIKGQAPGLVNAVAMHIAHHQLAENCIITSFHHQALHQMKATAPHLRRGWLVQQIDDAICTQAQSLELFQLCPQAQSVSDATVARARKVAPEVRAWGVNGSNTQVIQLIERVVASGCDGMTINWPDWVVHRAMPDQSANGNVPR